MNIEKTFINKYTMYHGVLKLLRGFSSKHVAQSERLTLSSHENKIVFRIILNSFTHITDTRQNNKLKMGKSVTTNT